MQSILCYCDGRTRSHRARRMCLPVSGRHGWKFHFLQPAANLILDFFEVVANFLPPYRLPLRPHHRRQYSSHPLRRHRTSSPALVSISCRATSAQPSERPAVRLTLLPATASATSKHLVAHFRARSHVVGLYTAKRSNWPVTERRYHTAICTGVTNRRSIDITGECWHLVHTSGRPRNDCSV